MGNLEDVTVATCQDNTINMKDVLKALKFGGHMSFLGEAIRMITVLKI